MSKRMEALALENQVKILYRELGSGNLSPDQETAKLENINQLLSHGEASELGANFINNLPAQDTVKIALSINNAGKIKANDGKTANTFESTYEDYNKAIDLFTSLLHDSPSDDILITTMKDAEMSKMVTDARNAYKKLNSGDKGKIQDAFSSHQKALDFLINYEEPKTYSNLAYYGAAIATVAAAATGIYIYRNPELKTKIANFFKSPKAKAAGGVAAAADQAPDQAPGLGNGAAGLGDGAPGLGDGAAGLGDGAPGLGGLPKSTTTTPSTETGGIPKSTTTTSSTETAFTTESLAALPAADPSLVGLAAMNAYREEMAAESEEQEEEKEKEKEKAVPVAEKPVPAKPVVKPAEADKPVAKPVVKTAEADKPVAKPVVKTAEAEKPVVKPVSADKPVVKTAEAEKPVVKPIPAVEKPVPAAAKPVEKPVPAAAKPVEKPIPAVEKPVPAAAKPVEKPVEGLSSSSELDQEPLQELDINILPISDFHE